MLWLDILGTGVGTLLGLLVGALIAAAGFNMATNRSGKADQLAADYQEALHRDKRRGLGWLHWSAGTSSDPRSYQAAGWVILVVSVAIILAVMVGLFSHVAGWLHPIR